MNVLVLSTGYEPLYRAPWQQAISDVFRGRVEIVEHHPEHTIGTVTGNIPMPTIVRFREGVFLNKLRQRRRYIRLNRKNIWLRDGGRCQYCNCSISLSSFEIEHVMPRSRGGQTTWENIVASCALCNQKKGAMTPEEANMRLLKMPVAPKLDVNSFYCAKNE